MPDIPADIAAGGRIWTVKLTMQQTLTTHVIADNDTVKEQLTELALRQADDGTAHWETEWAETDARWT